MNHQIRLSAYLLGLHSLSTSRSSPRTHNRIPLFTHMMFSSSSSPNTVTEADKMHSSEEPSSANNKTRINKDGIDGHKSTDSVCTRLFNESEPAEPEDKPSSSSMSVLALPMHEIRSNLLLLSERAGDLSRLFRTKMPLDREPRSTTNQVVPSAVDPEITLSMSRLLADLIATSTLCAMDLPSAIRRKMELNRRKYPADICKGKAGKYTQYSNATGITRAHGQETALDETSLALDASAEEAQAQFLQVLPQLRRDIVSFAAERLWDQYHTPRSLLLALIGELGELAELFQWKPDVDEASVKKESLDKVGQELADVTIYLIRLADVTGVTLRTTDLE